MDKQNGMVMRSAEDWRSVWVGFLFCCATFVGIFAGRDLLGWVAVTNPSLWTDLAKSLAPASRGYVGIPGYILAILTYLVVLASVTAAAKTLGWNIRAFVAGFSLIFWASLGCLILGSWAYIAAPFNQWKALGIGWSLGLTSESGLIIALLAGFCLNLLILGINHFFSGHLLWLKEVAKPEWYIKIGLVMWGAYLGVQVGSGAMGTVGLAKTIALRGFLAAAVLCCTVFPLSYLVARKIFGFSREDAAPFAGAISICGLAAANALGDVVETRKEWLAMISCLVVIFSSAEIIANPPIIGSFFYHEPFVAAAIVAGTTKTDGAVAPSAVVTESVIQKKTLGDSGLRYAPNGIPMVAATMKMFSDAFIVVFALLFGWIRSRCGTGIPGKKIGLREMYYLFPKFMVGFAAMFSVLFFLTFHLPNTLTAFKLGASEVNGIRSIFFAMTLFSYGLTIDLVKFLKGGFAKLVGAWATCFVIVVSLTVGVSWIAFHGIRPPMVK